MSTTENTSSAENVDWGNHPTADDSLPEVVDWIVGIVVALFGLLLTIGGSAFVFLVDREMLAQGVEEGTITVVVFTRELTQAEMLEVVEAVVSWTGIGLLLIGAGMVVFAIGYVVARHRAHRRAGPDEPVNSYGTYAILGAIAAAVFSFLPFSPALGGALAGYLERGESDRAVSAGALAGLLAFLPLLLLLVCVLGGLVTGMLAIGESGVAVVAGAAVLFALALTATIGAGLGALGGYAGGRFAESRADFD